MRVPPFLVPTVFTFPVWGACLLAMAELGRFGIYLGVVALLSWSMFVAQRSGRSDPLHLYLKAAAYLLCGFVAAALSWWAVRCLVFQRCT